MSQVCLNDENVLYMYPNLEIQIHSLTEFIHVMPNMFGKKIHFFVEKYILYNIYICSDINTIKTIITESYLELFYEFIYQEVKDCLDIDKMLKEISKKEDNDYSIFVYLSQKCTTVFFKAYRDLKDQKKFRKEPHVLLPFSIFYKEQMEYYQIDVFIYKYNILLIV